jgi:adenylate kinase
MLMIVIVKRLIIIGPPGSKRKEISLSLAEYMSEERPIEGVSVGELLHREIVKKSEYGKQILESMKTYSYVKDEIVISVVKNRIEELEKEQTSWIMEGFPRTRLQALALQEMRILPDKFILLNVTSSQSIEKVKKNLKSEESIVKYKAEEIDQLSKSAINEYKLNIDGVKEVCKGSVTELDGNKPEGVLLEEIVRILKLNKSNAPRRPPRIILLGP